MTGICPYCKVEVEKLRYREEQTHYGYYQDGDFDENDYEYHDIVFLCPECDSELTSSQVVADAFLRGEEIDKITIQNEKDINEIELGKGI